MDNIYQYKMKRLEKFLCSVPLEDFNKLIDIKIEQLNFQHPDYCLVDSMIDVHFGKLECNYKPETVESLMLFFLPPPTEKKEDSQQTTQILSETNMTKS